MFQRLIWILSEKKVFNARRDFWIMSYTPPVKITKPINAEKVPFFFYVFNLSLSRNKYDKRSTLIQNTFSAYMLWYELLPVAVA